MNKPITTIPDMPLRALAYEILQTDSQRLVQPVNIRGDIYRVHIKVEYKKEDNANGRLCG